ncbi:ER membrane protein complex subunit 4 [Mycena venus]|uniref:ER membrane protein complex subunit 4 n=1 Tax=Mycena venus TaxID=2733690 RepID=A0A8H6Y8E6_9AGAR|nr:ER membrane protein complex subunit 4 [Mycena venus]
MSKTLEYSTLESSSKWRSLPPPPGFSRSTSSKIGSKTSSVPPPEAYNQIKEKRALDFATAPAKSLPMQAFMLYMSGSGVQIFSIGIVVMLLISPFKNLAGMNEAFAQFAPSTAKNPKAFTTLPLQKLVYIACNVLTLAVGLWKCRSMGLLPLGTGDWLAFETRGIAPEIALF